MHKLFKKLDETELRSINYKIRLTTAEAAKIKEAAKIRNPSVAEYFQGKRIKNSLQTSG